MFQQIAEFLNRILTHLVTEPLHFFRRSLSVIGIELPTKLKLLPASKAVALFTLLKNV